MDGPAKLGHGLGDIHHMVTLYDRTHHIDNPIGKEAPIPIRHPLPPGGDLKHVDPLSLDNVFTDIKIAQTPEFDLGGHR